MEKDVLELTASQQKAFSNFLAFLDDADAKVFILKGYAGTGKTTLTRKFIEELSSREEKFSLLASTGRAAKILANATSRKAVTVHSEIYKFKDLSQDLDSITENKTQEEVRVDATGQLLLNFELMPLETNDNTRRYYIIDEASMISDLPDKNANQAVFGSGRLLKDLLDYDKNGKFIFVGDKCQLPPIQQSFSPALDASYLHEEYGVKVYEGELLQIMRQNKGNDIVMSAQMMRRLYHAPQQMKWAKFPLTGYRNIHVLESQTELVNRYIEKVSKDGFNEATIICLSNKQANIATQILRPNFGHHTKFLEKDDLLLVTQNNLISGLMNGDLVVVEDVKFHDIRAGLEFLSVKVKELFTKQTFSLLLIADVLYGNLTNISQSQQKDLLVDYYYRMKSQGIKQKSEMFKSMMFTDPYLNALRAVFGYSLTCHKSQGGEWPYVFLDIPRSLSCMDKPFVYQWVYTAMTRAKKELFVVDGFWLM